MHHARHFFIPGLTTLVLSVVTIGGLHLFTIWTTLPAIDVRTLLAPPQGMVIEDRDGGELFRFFDTEDRSVIRLKELPRSTQLAFIAVEDKRFFTRGCIDVRALARALVANVFSYKSQGASTITQQLARTVYLTREKTVDRKIREMLLACKMERVLSKENILEQYLNWISFGHGVAGIRQASRQFFGKEPEHLTLAQSAVLASLPQRPTYFSPYGPHVRSRLRTIPSTESNGEINATANAEQMEMGLFPGWHIDDGNAVELMGRSNIVIALMEEQGFITESEVNEANASLRTMTVKPFAHSIRAPHFVLSLKDELDQFIAREPMMTQERSLFIRTTIDPVLQRMAEDTIAKHMPTMRDEFGAHNVALLAVDRTTNEIIAYVGNADFFDDTHGGQIDMVRVPRQPGSSFKPIVYAGYLERGATADTVIYDNRVGTPYIPFSKGHYGRMTIRTALARSRNVPAVKAFIEAGGEDAVLERAASMGIGTPLRYKTVERNAGYSFTYGWPLALGSAEASVLEMVQAYSVIARSGMMKPLIAVTSIRGANEATLFTPRHSDTRVLKPETATELTSILSDEDAREPDWRWWMHVPHSSAALKTGTGSFCSKRNVYGVCTELQRNNNWTIGFDDRFLVGVWIGNVDNAPITQDALVMATPIWKDFLIAAHNHPLSTP